MIPNHMPPAYSRRTLLRGAAFAAVGAGLASLTACTSDASPQQLSLAGGERGGFYLQFAGLLADAITRKGLAQTGDAVVTMGSQDNLRLLASGEVDLGIAHADSVLSDPEWSEEVLALGSIYQNYLHCMVRADSEIRSIGDLAGRRVSLGALGSGTHLTSQRIVAAAGMKAGASGAISERALGLNDGLEALKNGTIDAQFWSGGIPTERVLAADAQFGVRLLPLSGVLSTLRDSYGSVYEPAVIPAGSYGDLPSIETFGVANLLLCRRDLSVDLVQAITRLLVTEARHLIPESTMGLQFLTPDTLINTAGIALHPGAISAYRELHG